MTEFTRRAFLQGSTVAVAGLVIGCRTHATAKWKEAPGAAEFDAWIQITPADDVLVYVDKVEMGQGTLTGFATLVGEELELDPQRIKVRHASVDSRYRVPGPIQGTGGSTSLVDRWVPLRESAARARVLLERAGAERMGVPIDEVDARDGFVRHAASGRALSYGALAEDAARREPPKEVTLKSPSEFRFIGKSKPRVDGAIKSQGKALYGIDTQGDGLLTAVVVRPDRPGDEIERFDAAAALEVPGVVEVFESPTGVAVLAEGYWPARKAASLVELEVEHEDRSEATSTVLRAEQHRRLQEESGKEIRDDGNVKKALERSERTLDVEYFTGHQAHATMEPMNCTVAPTEERVDVYLGTQAPDVIQDCVAGVLGRSRDEVVVHTAMLGGGFGRRFFPDVAIEAAEIAKRANRPVKLVWSREDDMARDFYRPATAHRMRGGVDAEGSPTAWEHKMVAPSLIPHMAPNLAGALGPAWMRGFVNGSAERMARLVPKIMGPMLAHEGAEHLPYEIESIRVESLLYDPGHQRRHLALGRALEQRLRGRELRRRAGRAGGSRPDRVPPRAPGRPPEASRVSGPGRREGGLGITGGRPTPGRCGARIVRHGRGPGGRGLGGGRRDRRRAGRVRRTRRHGGQSGDREGTDRERRDLRAHRHPEGGDDL